jgi:hypothetical protein
MILQREQFDRPEPAADRHIAQRKGYRPPEDRVAHARETCRQCHSDTYRRVRDRDQASVNPQPRGPRCSRRDKDLKPASAMPPPFGSASSRYFHCSLWRRPPTGYATLCNV